MPDSFVKSPNAALRFISRHGDAPEEGSHPSVVARLASGSFYVAGYCSTYCETVNA
jgi:hypothetical protein